MSLSTCICLHGRHQADPVSLNVGIWIALQLRATPLYIGTLMLIHQKYSRLILRQQPVELAQGNSKDPWHK